MRPGSLRRRRRLVRLGCLPMTCALTVCLLLMVDLVVISKAPPWVINPRDYLLGQRIVSTLSVLAGLNLVSTWLLGLISAAMAAPAAAGQGGLLHRRLTILRRRTDMMAWAVFMLRLAFLIGFVVAVILASTYLTDAQSAREINNTIVALRQYVVWVVFVLSVGLAHFLLGPFLRLRYSMALGTLAATWARLRDGRIWRAIMARTAANLLGVVVLLWGGSLGAIIFATIRRPFSRSALIDFHRVFFPALTVSWDVGRMLLFSIGVALALCLYMIGQLVLPPFYLRLARRRLAHGSQGAKQSGRRWNPKQIEGTSSQSASKGLAADIS
ncbi:MAG: hypothetical protein JXB07_05390 [Anaerolineae bacterium]|nr:hypothetical protein [Anaerolineae bacterium]